MDGLGRSNECTLHITDVKGNQVLIRSNSSFVFTRIKGSLALDSTLSLTKGSVFEIRRLNRQSEYAMERPSM